MCIPEFKLMLTTRNLIAIDRSVSCEWSKIWEKKHTHRPQLHSYILKKEEDQIIEYNLVPPVSAHATNMDFSVNITKLILDNDSTDQTNMNLTRIYWKENQEVDAT